MHLQENGGNRLMAISSQRAEEGAPSAVSPCSQRVNPPGLPIRPLSGHKDVFESLFETG